MARELAGIGDGNTLFFPTTAAYSDEVLTVGTVPMDPFTDYTLSALGITFLPAAFPASATPGAPPLGDRVVIRGQINVNVITSSTPAAHDYTADNLIQLVRDITYAGTSLRDWDNPRILRAFNRLIDSYLVPFVTKARKGHLITSTDRALVTNQANYFVPSAAAGGKLRALQLWNPTNNSPYADLREGSQEEIINFGAGIYGGPLPTGTPRLYYFLGNQVVLFPAPSGLPAGILLRFYHPARPSALVLAGNCVQITSFPAGAAPNGSFRVGYAGAASAGFVVSAGVDLVQNVPGFDILLSGAISASGVSYFEMIGTKPTQLAIGDWLCLSDTAPVVTGMIADLVLGCLVDKTALEVMAGKDKQGFELRLRLLKENEKTADAFLRRRNEGDHPKVGGGSLFRFRRGWASA